MITPIPKRSHTTVIGETSINATLVAMKDTPQTITAKSVFAIALPWLSFMVFEFIIGGGKSHFAHLRISCKMVSC
jgi:hypothetical protein